MSMNLTKLRLITSTLFIISLVAPWNWMYYGIAGYRESKNGLSIFSSIYHLLISPNANDWLSPVWLWGLLLFIMLLGRLAVFLYVGLSFFSAIRPRMVIFNKKLSKWVLMFLFFSAISVLLSFPTYNSSYAWGFWVMCFSLVLATIIETTNLIKNIAV